MSKFGMGTLGDGVFGDSAFNNGASAPLNPEPIIRQPTTVGLASSQILDTTYKSNRVWLRTTGADTLRVEVENATGGGWPSGVVLEIVTSASPNQTVLTVPTGAVDVNSTAATQVQIDLPIGGSEIAMVRVKTPGAGTVVVSMTATKQ